mgnify:CR=1 FL=1
MNTCEHYRLQISQLLDGELPEAQQQTLRAHLHTCPDCQRVYDDFLTLQAAVRGTAAEPPADLTARIMQQVRLQPAPAARPAQPTPVRRAPRTKETAKKRPDGRISPLLPISVMAACLALILGATMWFTPHRNPSGSGSTALDSLRTQTESVTPTGNDTAQNEPEQSPAPETAPVLDDSVSSLLFSVPNDSAKGSGADSSTLHISERKTIEALSALLVRTQPTQPPDAANAPLCTLEETNADGSVTQVTVWLDGKDIIFASSTDAQHYRVPGAAAEFCRLTGLPEGGT